MKFNVTAKLNNGRKVTVTVNARHAEMAPDALINWALRAGHEVTSIGKVKRVTA